jgi:hypothetical protein
MIETAPVVFSDTIFSEDMMAIGTVEISCQKYDEYIATGFCEKLFRKINLDNGSIELQLFDMKPNYTFCIIDCYIIRAEIYDSFGNLLNLSIVRDNHTRNNEKQDESEGQDNLNKSGKNEKQEKSSVYYLNRAIGVVLISALFLYLFIFFYKHKNKKK